VDAVTASSVVTPVVPPTIAPGPNGRASTPGTARRVLPVARLAAASRARSTVYGLATIDCNGRVAETAVINALGRVPGTRLDIRESGRLVLALVTVGPSTGQPHYLWLENTSSSITCAIGAHMSH
jgi:hypothetical protein